MLSSCFYDVLLHLCYVLYCNNMASPGCASYVLKSEAVGSLIAPWWLDAVQVINLALSMQANGT